MVRLGPQPTISASWDSWSPLRSTIFACHAAVFALSRSFNGRVENVSAYTNLARLEGKQSTNNGEKSWRASSKMAAGNPEGTGSRSAKRHGWMKTHPSVLGMPHSVFHVDVLPRDALGRTWKDASNYHRFSNTFERPRAVVGR